MTWMSYRLARAVALKQTSFYSHGYRNEIGLKWIMHLVLPNCFAILISYIPFRPQPHFSFLSSIRFTSLCHSPLGQRLFCFCAFRGRDPWALESSYINFVKPGIHHDSPLQDRGGEMDIGWVFSGVIAYLWLTWVSQKSEKVRESVTGTQQW